jgi:hypothetical protein
MAEAARRRATLFIVRAWLEDDVEAALRVRFTQVIDDQVLVIYAATIEDVERIVRQQLAGLLSEDQAEVQ